MGEAALQITGLEPGIYEGIPDKEYHLLEYKGSSPLKKFHNQPSSIFEPTEVTEDMELGSAQHAFSLQGPEVFHSQFVVGLNRGNRSADDKKAHAEFTLEHLGKTVLPATVTTKKIPTLQAIIDVDNFLFREHPLSKIIMRTGSSELAVIWDDEATGYRCKARLDRYPDPDKRMIVDLKKCARIDKFPWQMRELKYTIQSGHYTNGVNVHDHLADAFTFIAFNFGNPPGIRIITLTGDYLQKQCNLAKTTLRLLKECEEAGVYPKYPIPLETESMASILGIKSPISKQLSPWDYLEVME